MEIVYSVIVNGREIERVSREFMVMSNYTQMKQMYEGVVEIKRDKVKIEDDFDLVYPKEAVMRPTVDF